MTDRPPTQAEVMDAFSAERTAYEAYLTAGTLADNLGRTIKELRNGGGTVTWQQFDDYLAARDEMERLHHEWVAAGETAAEKHFAYQDAALAGVA